MGVVCGNEGLVYRACWNELRSSFGWGSVFRDELVTGKVFSAVNYKIRIGVLVYKTTGEGTFYIPFSEQPLINV